MVKGREFQSLEVKGTNELANAFVRSSKPVLELSYTSILDDYDDDGNDDRIAYRRAQIIGGRENRHRISEFSLLLCRFSFLPIFYNLLDAII